MRARLPESERIERFWAQVDKNGPLHPYTPELGQCWLWTGSPGSGYGQTRLVEGGKAHRAGYILQRGPIPAGAFICHTCDRPLCLRGTHLYVGNAFTNSCDTGRRKRHNARKGDTHPARFHSHPVFIPERLRDLRVEFAEARKRAGLTQQQLSARMGVAAITISRVERGVLGPGEQIARAWSEACGVHLSTA